MKLIAEPKRFLARAWSVRLAVLSGVLSGVEAILPIFSDAFPRGIFAGLSMLVAVAVPVVQVVSQPKTLP